jgi:hypothetical protein
MNPATDDLTDTGYLRPRDPVEIWLTRLWQEILGFGIGIRDGFFETGGNSLDAARVVNAVLTEFGLQLPLNVVTDHPTVESLAARLREEVEQPAGPLIEIQHGDGTRRALFLVHPSDGQVGPYCHLAYRLGDEFTLFGLQAGGLHSDIEPVRTVSAMADAYLDAVRAAQPEGPYLLGGCGVGAVIAHEMAARLGNAGAEVRLLAAIDPALVEAPDAVTGSWPPRDDQSAKNLADWQARHRVPDDETPDFVTRVLRVWQANQDAVRDWTPQPYPGALDVFRDPHGDRSQVVRSTAQRVHECASGDELAAALRGLIG